MAWQFPLTIKLPWTDGVTIPGSIDYQAIATDVQKWGGSVNAQGYGINNADFLYLRPAVLPGRSVNITGASWIGGVATVQIGATNLQVGQIITMSGVTSSGPGSFNVANVPISAVDPSASASYALGTNPGTWSSGGTLMTTAGSAAVPVNGTLGMRYDGVLWEWLSGNWVLPISPAPQIGINTGVPNPNVALDINGALSVRTFTISLVNGANEDVYTAGYGTVRVVGPTAPYSIGGFQGGNDGQLLTLMNDVPQTLTITSADTGSQPGNRIFSPKGTVTLNANSWSSARFIYQISNDNWWLLGWF